jgi:hypothetical protein
MKYTPGTYSVGYYVIKTDGHGNSEQEWIALFKKVSFGSAVKLVNALNGGAPLDVQELKVLEMCQP